MLQSYLKLNYPNVKLPDLINIIKERIKLTLKAVKYKINPNRRKYCFEIFGYDFIIDGDFYVILLIL